MAEGEKKAGGSAKGGAPDGGEQIKKLLLRSSEKAIRLLVKTMGDDSVKPETRVACASEILNRTYGKSGQAVQQAEGTVLELKGEAQEYAG